MENIINQFVLLKSENKQNRIVIFLFMFFCLFSDKLAAQATSGITSVDTLLSYWVLGGLAVVFIGIVLYVVRTALIVLHENGKTLEFSFPMIRNMAENGKTVTIVILIIVLCGVVWALNYGGW